MLARRVAIGCSAVAFLAVAGYVPATASPGAASTICVGLVVDPHSIGGSVSDTCVNVKPGTTGVGVLEAAGHTLTFRRDGLLCTIDGMPDSGCDAVDNLHYWAYFHRAPDSTSWSYSHEGMSTYQPENRETEGWVYDNGAPLTPKNIPAGQICKGLLKPAPAPSPKQTHQAAGHPRPQSSTPAASASATPTASPTPARHRRHHHRHSATPSPGPTLPGAVQTSEPQPTVSAAANTRDSGGNGSDATGAIVAAAVVAVLAAATVIGARRRRRP